MILVHERRLFFLSLSFSRGRGDNSPKITAIFQRLICRDKSGNSFSSREARLTRARPLLKSSRVQLTLIEPHYGAGPVRRVWAVGKPWTVSLALSLSPLSLRRIYFCFLRNYLVSILHTIKVNAFSTRQGSSCMNLS